MGRLASRGSEQGSIWGSTRSAFARSIAGFHVCCINEKLARSSRFQAFRPRAPRPWGSNPDLALRLIRQSAKKEDTTCYMRDFDVISLVGPTELKAQIGWVEPATVSPQGIIPCSPLFPSSVAYRSRERRRGSNHRFRSLSFLRSNPLFRSDVAVVYDIPSEETQRDCLNWLVPASMFVWGLGLGCAIRVGGHLLQSKPVVCA